MVRGLEIFRQHFKEFTDNYIIIGEPLVILLLIM